MHRVWRRRQQSIEQAVASVRRETEAALSQTSAHAKAQFNLVQVTRDLEGPGSGLAARVIFMGGIFIQDPLWIGSAPSGGASSSSELHQPEPENYFGSAEYEVQRNERQVLDEHVADPCSGSASEFGGLLKYSMRTEDHPPGFYTDDNSPPANKQLWQIEGQGSSEAQSKEELTEGSRQHIGGVRAHCGNDFKVGEPVQKEFEGQMYSGVITFAPVNVGAGYYHVVYEDGDEEDVDHSELKMMLEPKLVLEGADGGGGGGGGPSDYELFRMENIQRNKEYLRSLEPERTTERRGTKRPRSHLSNPTYVCWVWILNVR